jgi:plastocyanin
MEFLNVRSATPFLVSAAIGMAGTIAGAATIDINQVGFTYNPDFVEVHPGDTVNWHWASDLHSVTFAAAATGCSPSGVFSQSLSSANPTVTYVIPEAQPTGQLRYYCIPHCSLFGMDGILNVTPVPLVGDLNGDGHVNGFDLAILLGAWGRCPAPPDPCPADLNGNGVVNGIDLGILLGNWTG